MCRFFTFSPWKKIKNAMPRILTTCGVLTGKPRWAKLKIPKYVIIWGLFFYTFPFNHFQTTPFFVTVSTFGQLTVQGSEGQGMGEEALPKRAASEMNWASGHGLGGGMV